LLKALRENEKSFISTQEIYTRIAPIIGNNSEQTPLCKPIRNVGDEGGQFVFVSSVATTTTTVAAPVPTTTLPNIPETVISPKPTVVAPAVSSRESDKKSFTNSIGMTFVYIPPGEFMMGSPENESERDSDEKQHKVKLTKGFYMQTTEVTQGQWKAVMGENPSSFKDCGDDCPVETVSWDYVQEFINKLNLDSARFPAGERNPTVGERNPAVGERSRTYRLPTEAEWEYAARAGTTTPYFWGSQADCSKANYGNGYSSECKEENPGKTVKVASFESNAYGLYDMHGNVWECCQDWYGDYPSGAVTDPTGPPSGSNLVGRGGGWDGYAQYCRSADRYGYSPGIRYVPLGFRLVLPAGQQR